MACSFLFRGKISDRKLSVGKSAAEAAAPGAGVSRAERVVLRCGNSGNIHKRVKKMTGGYFSA